MSELNKTSHGLHVETQGTNPTDIAETVCRTATDKQKCQEFVERLGEAANNIDRYSVSAR